MTTTRNRASLIVMYTLNLLICTLLASCEQDATHLNPDGIPVSVPTAQQLDKMIEEAAPGDTVILTQSLDLTSQPLTVTKDLTLYLPSDVTLTTRRFDADTDGQTAGIYVAPDATLTLTGTGTLQGDNRLVDVDGTLIADGIQFVTHTADQGTAILVTEEGQLRFRQGSIQAAFIALYIQGRARLTGGLIKSQSSSLDPLLTDASWTYAIRIEGRQADVTFAGDVHVRGVQGGISMDSPEGTLVIDGGTFETHPRYGNDNHYALALLSGQATVNGGNFYAESSHTLWVSVDFLPKELYLRGGHYTDQGIYAGTFQDRSAEQYGIHPDEGYAWAVDPVQLDDVTYPFEIVKA